MNKHYYHIPHRRDYIQDEEDPEQVAEDMIEAMNDKLDEVLEDDRQTEDN